MRDIKNVRPLNILLKRNILMFVTPLLVMLLAYIFFMIPTAHAAPVADIVWKENTIVYADHTYTGPTTAKDSDGHDLPKGTILYTYLEPRVPFTAQKSHVIYFDADVNPSEAATAQYVTYERNTTGGLSGKSPPKELSIDTTTSPSSPSNTSSNCRIDGVGWIVCPVANFLATGMDWVFGVLSGFVEVQPLETNSNSVMYRIWDMMRSIANVAFVIGFLVIIYAQLTSTGLSNYGIKKILPRIIVAAVLVNVSYWICVIAIDASNILGHSFQGVFLSLRDNILEGGGGNGWQLLSWESVTSFILAGGAAGGAALAGFVALSGTMGAFSVAGVALLLAPILVGAFLTILVVLLILAARQAIITLLVIISPLALVAYLLPNTEKWFEKWRSLFMTMLIFFPAFSLVFGGAQFAGLAIIQTADNINMILLGMAVQIAPLAITPLLLKLSGSLLSKVAGIINDPSKGLKDRTKNWSKDRLAARKAGEDRKTREMALNGTLRRRHVMRRTAMSADNRKRLRDGQKAVDESHTSSLFGATSMGHALDEAERDAERQKKIVHNQHEESWNIKAKIDPSSLDQELKLRISADKASLAALKMDSVYEEIKAGDRTAAESVYGSMPLGPQINAKMAERVDMLNSAKDTTTYLALEGIRKSQAADEHKTHVDKVLHENKTTVDGKSILEYAAGIGDQEMLQATTIARVRKEYGEHITAQAELMKHFKLDSSEFQAAAVGTRGDIVIDDERGKHTFKVTNEFVREAAINNQASAGSFGEKLELLEQSWGEKDATGKVVAKGTTYDYRDSIQSMVKGGMLNAAPFANDKSLNAILKGEYKGRESTVHHSIRQIYEGRVKSEAISTANNVAMEIMYNVKKDDVALHKFYDELNPATRPSFSKFMATFNANYSEMQMQATDVLLTPILSKNVNKELLDVLNQNALPRPKVTTAP